MSAQCGRFCAQSSESADVIFPSFLYNYFVEKGYIAAQEGNEMKDIYNKPELKNIAIEEEVEIVYVLLLAFPVKPKVL